MTAASKDRIWRYGSIALFCGLPLLLVALIVSNLIAASEAGSLAERQQTMLEQIIARVAKHGSQTLSDADKASLYLASPNDSLARAELQQKATKLVGEAGGRLVEAQFTGTPEQEADGVVAIQLSLDIDNKGLRDLLYATESSLPLLDVPDLSARTNNGQNDDRPSANGPLHVDMTVQGHWRKGTP